MNAVFVKMKTRSIVSLEQSHLAPRPDADPETGYQLRLSEEAIDPEWDAFLSMTPGGHHVQTSLWARVKALLGWRAVRILVTRSEQIVGGAQLLMRPLPFAGVMAYVPKGPVLASDDSVLAKIIIEGLHQVAKSYRVQYLVVQPPSNGEAIAGLLASRGFQPSTMQIGPTASILIDLAQDLDVILNQMKKATRKHIRRGLREGIVVREGTDGDLDTFYDLLTATSQRCQFSLYPKAYFDEMWRVFHPYGYVRLFFADYKGQPVSAYWVVCFGNTVISKKSGWSGLYAHRRPNEVLEWHVIKWAKTNGYDYYDLEGIDPGAARAVLQTGSLPKAFTQTATSFKLKFGGQAVLFPQTCDYVYNRMLRWACHWLFPRVADWLIVQRVISRFRTH